MGFWKGFLRFAVKFVFVISLFLTIFLVSFAQLTGKETIKPIINDLLKQQMSQQMDEMISQQAYMQLSQECVGKEKIEQDMIGTKTSISCAELKATDPSNLMGLFLSSLFDSLYNKKYDCPFIECLLNPDKGGPLILFNAATNILFWRLFTIFLIITIILAVISVLIAEKWFKEVRRIGMKCLIIGAMFFIFGFMVNFFLKPAGMLLQISSKLSSKMAMQFIILLVVGAVLTAVGVILGRLKKKNNQPT